MIVTGALLFFLGASVSATPLFPTLPKELIISKHRNGEDKVTVIPSTGHSSIIENYIQEGTNVFFKPQFVLSSEQMPPQLQPLIAAIEKDDCKKTYPLVTPVIVDEPLRVVEKEINGPLMTTIEHITEIKPAMIPEPIMPVVLPPSPVLPPMELPKPVPVMVEEFPLAVEYPYAPMAPVFYEEPKEIKIPPPGPVLPPMEMPKLPVMVEVPEMPIEHIVPFAPVMELEEKVVEVPVMIPPGPILPPMTLPNLPVLVEETPFVPEVHHVPEVSVAIPPGPVLPPVELPKLPVMVEHIPTVAELPCEHPVAVPVPVPAPVFVDVEVPKEHVVVPPAPVLPPLEIPKASLVIKEPMYIEQPIHMIPSAPLMPALEMPTLPLAEIRPHAFIEQEHFVLPVGMAYPDATKLVHIPEVQQLMVSSIPEFTKTNDCVNDIIVERVLPKMEKSIYTIRPDLPVPRLFL